MKRLIKWILKVVGLLALLILIFLTYAYFRIQIEEPQIADNSAFELERTELNDSVKICGQDWIRLDASGLYEMHLSGTPLELGVKHGLLAKELVAYQEEAFVAEIRNKVPSPSYLNFLKYFIGWFNRDMPDYIPLERQQEIYGVSRFTDPQYEFIAPSYQRILNYHGAHDIGHALQNMNLVACTAFGVWGDKSKDGELIIGRNFDFYVGDQFAEEKIVAFYKPGTGHNFMFITWGGLTGVVSGMNEAGLSITLNSAKSDMPFAAYTPVSIVARQILQNSSTIAEAYAEAQKYKTFVAESFMIGSAIDGKAAIIEKSPDKTALFEVNGSQIIGTNHYQSEVFAQDPLNIENIAESASMYRFERMEELLVNYTKLDYLDVAEILRDQKGLKNEDIGLCNEKAVNQLIAHHSIVFKPKLKQVWVSTSDFQLGEYVCYDLNKAFADSANYKSMIHIDSLKIAEDPFIHSSAYQNAKMYRQGVRDIQKAMQKDSLLSDSYIEQFMASNPKFFHVYKVAGDYYAAQVTKDKSEDAKQMAEKAIAVYKKAFACEFPRVIDRTDIEERITTLKESI